ncbi:MAG: hypothetical protein PVI57_20515 [Gemmatimonadota bacterium]|jgi:hypothetical protein
MSLSDVLARYRDVEHAPLGGDERRRLSDEERAALRADLERIERTNGRIVWIAVGLLLALFVAWWGVVFMGEGDAGRAQLASGAFGLSAAGCVRWLLRVWREKSSAALLLRLAVDLEGDSLATVINVLADRSRA